MKETILAKATKTVAAPTLAQQYGETAVNITITAQAYLLGGNSHPHFSVTADIYNPRKSGDARDIAGGCCHAEAANYWPAIKPIIALHLSNADNGEPMHAEANGFYWLAGCLPGNAGEQYHGGNSKIQHWKPDGSFDGYRESTPDECLAIFADHMRVDLETAKAMRDKVSAHITTTPDVFKFKKQCVHARQEFAEICHAHRARWRSEAEAGLALIKSLAK